MCKKVNRSIYIVLIICALIGLTGCGALRPGPDIAFDFEKQTTFKNQFQKGMSRQQVEDIILAIKDVSFSSQVALSNDQIAVYYDTDVKEYGATQFFFVYDSESVLLLVAATEP